MARNLTFAVGEQEYPTTPVKIERKKVYGWTETLALDDNGDECKLVTLDETGTVIIPKGGMGLGLLDNEGKWVNRSTLKAVTLEGEPAELQKSSYEGVIELNKTVTAEEFLDHSITAFYQITEAEPELLEAIGDNIYTFTYAYRDGYTSTPAFLLESGGFLYLLTGYLAPFTMLSLEQAGAITEEEDTEEEEDDGDIDFSMM